MISNSEVIYKDCVLDVVQKVLRKKRCLPNNIILNKKNLGNEQFKTCHLDCEKEMSTDENFHIYTNEKCKNKKDNDITTMKHTLKNDCVSASICYKCEPILTPALKVKNNIEEPLDNSEIDYSNVEQHLYGPILPEHLRNSIKEFDDKSKANNLCDSPNSDSAKKKKLLSPAIPSHHLLSTISTQQEKNSDTDESFGPSTSLMFRSDDLPVIPSKSFMLLRKESNATTVKRESWMLELPSKKITAFGIGPRQFKPRDDEKNDDSSTWTETPADKARRRNQIDSKDDKNIMRLKQVEEKDRMMEKLRKKARKKNKRKESLLEIHRKKIKKQAKKEAAKRENDKKPSERRPFNRNIDLLVNRFDPSQKREIINKAQLLNNRFRQGESKFL